MNLPKWRISGFLPGRICLSQGKVTAAYSEKTSITPICHCTGCQWPGSGSGGCGSGLCEERLELLPARRSWFRPSLQQAMARHRWAQQPSSKLVAPLKTVQKFCFIYYFVLFCCTVIYWWPILQLLYSFYCVFNQLGGGAILPGYSLGGIIIYGPIRKQIIIASRETWHNVQHGSFFCQIHG